MLKTKEYAYFTAMRDYIKRLFRLSVDIYPLNHRAFIPMGEGEEVLGCCHRVNDNEGNPILYVITIDEPYIRACYYGRQTAYSPYSDNQLIETICHEIAHMYIWEHGKDHTQLTNELYDSVIKSLNFTNKGIDNYQANML